MWHFLIEIPISCRNACAHSLPWECAHATWMSFASKVRYLLEKPPWRAYGPQIQTLLNISSYLFRRVCLCARFEVRRHSFGNVHACNKMVE